jgi:hypothetical protein
MPKKSTRGSDTKAPELTAVARELRNWRAKGRPGRRIPEALWRAAANAGRVHGLSRAVTALGLNYYDLQRRVLGGAAGRAERERAPRFVELPAAMPTPGGGPERGTLEVVHAGGTRLILRLPGASGADVLAVVELFLRSGR